MEEKEDDDELFFVILPTIIPYPSEEKRPIHTSSLTGAVSTLNQRYPLLQHEDAAPVQHLMATWRMVPNPTIRAGPRAPRGKER